MKNIIIDFLRGWSWIFVLAVLFIAISPKVIFAAFLMMPFAIEWGRRPVRVMITLPVSRRTIALSYWCIAVLFPVLLMTAFLALNALLFPSTAASPKSAVRVLVGSLAFVGSGFCLVAFNAYDKRDSSLGNLLVTYLASSPLIFGTLNVTPESPLVYAFVATGLILTVWGYLHCETLMFGRARNSPRGKPTPIRTAKRTLYLAPKVAGFRHVLFNIVWRSFVGGLLVSMLSLVLVLSVDICRDGVHSEFEWRHAFTANLASVHRPTGLNIVAHSYTRPAGDDPWSRNHPLHYSRSITESLSDFFNVRNCRDHLRGIRFYTSIWK
jgi:hypothetical protein